MIHSIINQNLLNTIQRQHYFQYRRTQQACSKNYYDKYKIGTHGNIDIGIPTPDRKIPIIPLGNNYYEIEKNPTDSSSTCLRTETSKTHKKVTTIFSFKRNLIISFIYWC